MRRPFSLKVIDAPQDFVASNFSLRLGKHNLEDYATKMHNLEDYATKMHNLEDYATKMATCVKMGRSWVLLALNPTYTSLSNQ